MARGSSPPPYGLVSRVSLDQDYPISDHVGHVWAPAAVAEPTRADGGLLKCFCTGGTVLARRTFFSFHYKPDVWRAWNVRNSWVVTDDQEDIGFFDSSVFEASKKESDESLKAFLRNGLQNTSVTCVLAGAKTWTRRWVRYEIARSVVKGNGLLTIHIHRVKNSGGQVAEKGANPLVAMGLYKTSGGIYLAEWVNEKWIRYQDYTRAIPESELWFEAPKTTSVVKLSEHCMSYDFVGQNGRQNIGGWIELAAELAGR